VRLSDHGIPQEVDHPQQLSHQLSKLGHFVAVTS